MKALLSTSTILVLLCFVAGADRPELPTTRAIEAQVRYANELTIAKADYDQSVRVARKKYLAELEAENLVVMKSGDLGAANEIQAKMEEVDHPIVATEAKDGKPRLDIRKAKNGAGDQWFDVTDLIRNSVRNGILKGYGPLPWVPNRANTLVIDGTYGKEEFELSINAADVGETLQFGRVPMANE